MCACELFKGPRVRTIEKKMSIVPLERLNNHRKFLVKHRIDYEKVAVDTKRTSLDPDDGKARFFERALARTKQSEIQSKNPTSEGYIFKI